MANDRRPRRAVSRWETLRESRALTPPQGVPAHVDPEVTPPPMEPPNPATIEGFETIPPSIARQLEMLHGGQAQLTTAITRVWPARDVSSQIEHLQREVSGYTRDVAESSALLQGFVMPAIKTAMTRLDVLTSHHERNAGRSERLFSEELPRLSEAVSKLATQIETAVRKLDDRLDLLDQRQARMESALDMVAMHTLQLKQHDDRLAMMERRNADKDAGDQREALVVKRHRAYAMALVSAISTAAGIVGGWLGFG